jgi:hypothetical protein
VSNRHCSVERGTAVAGGGALLPAGALSLARAILDWVSLSGRETKTNADLSFQVLLKLMLGLSNALSGLFVTFFHFMMFCLLCTHTHTHTH